MSDEKSYCPEIKADPRGENWSDAARKHVADCPSCASYLEGYDQLSKRLKALPSSQETMPASLREKLEKQLADSAADISPARKGGALLSLPIVRRILLPTALAASLVLGIFLEKTFDFGSTSFPTEVEKTIGMYIADVTHDHYLLDRIGRPLEVEIPDPTELSSWLSTSLNFAFQLPETSGPLTLQGGRVWHTVGRLSALASYTTDTGNRVVLFAVPAENLKLSGAESALLGSTRIFSGEGWGHEARVWIDGDLAVALTAPEGQLPEDWDEIFLP